MTGREKESSVTSVKTISTACSQKLMTKKLASGSPSSIGATKVQHLKTQPTILGSQSTGSHWDKLLNRGSGMLNL